MGPALSNEWSPCRWGWMRQKDLHRGHQETQKKNFNCHANEKQMEFKTGWAKESEKGGSTAVVLCIPYLLYELLTCRLKGLSSFTTTPTAVLLGRTNHDLRVVAAARKTIVLCAGVEPRRGLDGQRVLSRDQPSSAAVSTSVCISVTHSMSIQHDAYIALGQRIDRFMLNPFNPVCVCVGGCVYVCVNSSVFMCSASSGTQKWRWSRRKAPEKET